MNRRRAALLFLVLAVLAVVVALPVLAASPSPSAGAAAATHKPEGTHGPHATKGPKAPGDKENGGADEVAVTLKGTVQATKDTDGESSYTLQSAGTTYTLDAGPSWFFGDAYPLAPYAGKSVTITGESPTGSTEVDVLTVDGKTLREPGKPPWAGGWKVVGKVHPGWSQEKADRQAAKAAAGHGRPSWARPKASDEPDESEAPGG